MRTLSLLLLLGSLAYTKETTDDSKLLYAFQVTRHGARTGLGMAVYDDPDFIYGELTGSGARQHYLMGRQMRKYLVEEEGLLSPEFNKDQIYVRSTDVNRTIDSALSQLQGIYEGAAPFQLEEQQEDILPPFGVREEVVAATQKDLGSWPLPNKMAATPVHVPPYRFDEYNPRGVCKPLGAIAHHLAHDDYIYFNLTAKYQKHVDEFGYHFFGAPIYNADYEIGSSDTVHSHWYDRRPTPGLSEEFLHTMMDVRRDYFLHKNCAYDWMPKVYTTKSFTTMLREFELAMAANDAGMADEPSRRRFYYWSDHDTGVQNYACVLDHLFEIYIPFDSQILFQLFAQGDQYQVGISINGAPIKLQGACGGQEKCAFATFRQLLASVTYIDDEATWEQQCVQGGPEYEESYMQELEDFLQNATQEQLEMEYLSGFDQ